MLFNQVYFLTLIHLVLQTYLQGRYFYHFKILILCYIYLMIFFLNLFEFL